MERDAQERLDYLLSTREYDDLSAEDKLWVEDHLGEHAYRKLHVIVRALNAERKLPVDSSVKSNLMNRFKSKHMPTWERVVHYKIPAYVAMVGILLAAVLSLLFSDSTGEHVRTADSPSPVYLPADTVVKYVRDTVFVERVVKEPVYLASRKTTVEKSTAAGKTVPVPGRPLADQTDVRRLLVRSE